MPAVRPTGMGRLAGPCHLLLAATAAALLTGCQVIPGAGAPRCSVDPADAPVEVLDEPDVATAPKNRATLGVDVTSTLDEPVRVTVRLDRRLALDVEVPGSAAECAHEPVYRYDYRPTGAAATVTVRTDQGQRDSARVDLSNGKRWVVIQVQAGFPLELAVWDEEPAWG
jgi:hypothetical protein